MDYTTLVQTGNAVQNRADKRFFLIPLKRCDYFRICAFSLNLVRYDIILGSAPKEVLDKNIVS